MGSKGTSTQQQTSTYTPSPQISAAGTQALTQAQNAAATPFNLPTAPVAGFNPQQQQAFQQYGQVQNLYQPYYNQAQQYFNQSAQPISGQQVSQYLNPYAGYVLGNLQEQQGQQMQQLTGQATQTAGGVGADRIGVAQGELARQQGLATGQTLAGIYGSALGAAQQQQQMEQAAGYGLGNLGGANLNSALAATGALYGSGAYQQQLNQAQLNAQYQNQLQQQAYPFQTAQYLANITGGLSGALGSQTSAYGSATPAQPSILGQVAGAGALGLGVYGALGNTGTPANYLNPGSIYGTGNGQISAGGAAGPTPFYRSGGRAYDDGGGVGGGVTDDLSQNFGSESSGADIGGKYRDWLGTDTDVPSGKLTTPAAPHHPQLMNMNSGSGSGSGGKGSGDIMGTIANGAKIAALFAARGGRTHYDAGGGDDSFLDSWQDRVTSPFQLAAGAGETPNENVARRFPGMTSVGGMDNIVGGEPSSSPYVPPPRERPAEADQGVEPVRMLGSTWGPQGPPQDAPISEVSGNSGTPRSVQLAAQPQAEDNPYKTPPQLQAQLDKNRQEMEGQTYAGQLPYGDLDLTNDKSRQIAKSPWTALIAAGAGALASGSPWPGVAIGKGGLEGLKALEQQRKDLESEEGINQRAKQLAQQAAFHLDEFTKMKPSDMASLGIRQQQLEQQGWQKGAEMVNGDTTWVKPSTGESLIVHANGTVSQGRGATGAPAPGISGAPAPAPAMQPPAPPAPHPSEPPPVGVKELSGDNSAPQIPPPLVPKNYLPIINQQTKLIDTEIQKKAQNLPDLENNLTSMKQAYATLMADRDKDGFLTQLLTAPGAALFNGYGLGNHADTVQGRLERARELNTMAQMGGKPPVVNPNKLAAAEEMAKIQSRMGAAFAAQISSRPAFAMEKIGINATPGLSNTPQGFLALVPSFDAAVRNTKDQVEHWADWQAKNPYSPNQWRSEFMKTHPADRYFVRSVLENIPSKELKEKLPEAIEHIRKNPTKENIAEFNKRFHGTASYFLTGKMAPYEGGTP